MEQNHVESMLSQVLLKIDEINGRITHIQVEAANNRADAVEKFSTMVFETTRAFDEKIVRVERRLDDKMILRNEKVDNWFDQNALDFANHKTDMASKITSVSVKIGLIFSAGTAILVALITGLLRYFMS